MVNYLKPDVIEVEVKISERVMKALVASGRLKMHQQADDLAIRQALKQLIDDLVAGKEF